MIPIRRSGPRQWLPIASAATVTLAGDMCSNGRYTERGIKQVDGFMAERWRIEPDYAVRVDKDLGVLGVLLEPATVAAKAWEHVAAIGRGLRPAGTVLGSTRADA